MLEDWISFDGISGWSVHKKGESRRKEIKGGFQFPPHWVSPSITSQSPSHLRKRSFKVRWPNRIIRNSDQGQKYNQMIIKDDLQPKVYSLLLNHKRTTKISCENYDLAKITILWLINVRSAMTKLVSTKNTVNHSIVGFYSFVSIFQTFTQKVKSHSK